MAEIEFYFAAQSEPFFFARNALMIFEFYCFKRTMAKLLIKFLDKTRAGTGRFKFEDKKE